jgi:hypothetical protein
MKRLCFLSPDINHAKLVVDDLRADGVAESQIYVIAKLGTPMQDLPDGGPEDDDFIPAFERGIVIGGTTGILLGLFALTIPPAGIVVGGGAVLLGGVMGASLGGLLTGIAGSAFSNSRLKKFAKEIEGGKVLIMVDVPMDRVTHINNLIMQFDPDVEIDGFEPSAPLIPK